MPLARGAVAVAVVAALAAASGAAAETGPGPSSGCRGSARMVDFGSDGRIGAKWNAATRTIAYGRPRVEDGHYHTFLADADGDNDSDGADFLIWQRQFGSKPGMGAGSGFDASVPEPSSFALVLFALLAFGARTIRRMNAPLSPAP